jgi:hypothetical protein
MLDKITHNVPPITALVLLSAAVVVFIIGFSRRGLNFMKYGFGEMALEDSFGDRFDRLEESLDKRFDDMDKRFDKRFQDIDKRFDDMDKRFDKRFDDVDKRITVIETNHFGHLKNFLGELTSILLDKEILNNQDKARLDNQLRGM